MRKRRYPPGERKDRIAKVLEYIASNPNCRRLNIQAHMNFVYRTQVGTHLISDCLSSLLSVKAIEEKDGQFSITKNGELMLARFTHEK